MRVSSSVGVAQGAVSRFAEVRLESPGTQASVGASNLPGMQAGERLANQVLNDLASVVSSMQEQAQQVPALAASIAQRDSADAGAWR